MSRCWQHDPAERVSARSVEAELDDVIAEIRTVSGTQANQSRLPKKNRIMDDLKVALRHWVQCADLLFV